MEKEFKTIEEQIEILLQKGIIIDNRERALEILEKDNYYYLINGYKDLFVYIDETDSKEKYKENTKLEEIYNLYKLNYKKMCSFFLVFCFGCINI